MFSVRFSTMSFVRVCRIRVCVYSSSVAKSGECCQSYVDRPRTPHACVHSPSVKLLRKFQCCKSGPISFRSFVRLILRKEENVPQSFSLKVQTCPPGVCNRRSPQGSGRSPTSSSSSTADSASASRRETAVGKPQFGGSRTSSAGPTAAQRPRGHRPPAHGLDAHRPLARGSDRSSGGRSPSL